MSLPFGFPRGPLVIDRWCYTSNPPPPQTPFHNGVTDVLSLYMAEEIFHCISILTKTLPVELTVEQESSTLGQEDGGNSTNPLGCEPSGHRNT